MSEVLATSLCSTPKSTITSCTVCKLPCMQPPTPAQWMSAPGPQCFCDLWACGQVLQPSDIGLQAQQVGQTQLTTASLRGPQWRKSSENPANDSAKSSVPQQRLVNFNVFSSICYSAKLFVLAGINSIRSIWAYYLHNSQDTLPSLWRTQFVTKKKKFHFLNTFFSLHLIALFVSSYDISRSKIILCICSGIFWPVLSNGVWVPLSYHIHTHVWNLSFSELAHHSHFKWVNLALHFLFQMFLHSCLRWNLPFCPGLFVSLRKRRKTWYPWALDMPGPGRWASILLSLCHHWQIMACLMFIKFTTNQANKAPVLWAVSVITSFSY